MKTVKEIHNAFSMIPKRKFEKEPLSIVSDDKAEKLKMLGFESSPLVVKLNNLIEENDNIEKRNKEKEEIVKAVNYFSCYYPNNIFLLDNEVEDLCEKFDLVLGRVSDFIGDVPDKNVEEMLSFKLQNFDRVFRKKSRFPLEIVNATICSINDVVERETYIVHRLWDGALEEIKFEIIATPNLFKNPKPSEIDDPIVVQRVMYNDVKGFLIISKWGNEASIDTLNYKNN